MKHTSYIISAVFLSFLALSCTKEDTTSYEITFTPQVTEGTRAAGLYTSTDLTSAGQFKVTGYDATNKKVIDGRTVTKSGSLWKFSDNPMVWGKDKNMTFWAEANMPSWASTSSSSSNSTTLTVDAIPSAAASQWDPLIGYYSGKGNAGNAPIIFYHPFVAVTFVTGDCGEPQIVSSITSVKLTGVYKSATATVTGGSSGLSFNWTPSGTTSVTGPFTGTKSTNPFILLPQNLESANISIEISITLVAGGSKTKTVELAVGQWQPGYHYTYTLDYIPYTPMEDTMTATLTDWVYIKSTSGKDFFDADFDD